MRPSITLFLFLFITTRLVAQTDAVMLQSTRDRINFSNLSIPTNGILYGIMGEPGKLLGDNYADSTFQAGTIKFYGPKIGKSDSLAGVPIRLDLLKHEIDIRMAPTDVRAVQAGAVRYFDRNNLMGSVSRFINVREFRGDADALSGFFEQIAGGKLVLLQHQSVFIKKGNFNAALNVGTKDDEIVKRAAWYATRGQKAEKFTPTRKTLLDLMADKQPQIETFLKEKRPDLKSRAGLTTVFNFYNTL